MRLDWPFCSICVFCIFFAGPIDIIYRPSSTEKRTYLYIFGSHGTIYNLKNYFTIIFLGISFQFLANKWYPNKLYILRLGLVLAEKNSFFFYFLTSFLRNKHTHLRERERKNVLTYFYYYSFYFCYFHGSHCTFWYYLWISLYYYS